MSLFFSSLNINLSLAKYKLSNSENTNSVGTAEYMAPEFISHQKFLPESDVFSFGITNNIIIIVHNLHEIF